MEFVKPMMAHRWGEEWEHLLDSDEYIAEEKLDGHRVHVFKADGQVHVLSRLGKPIDPGWWYELPLDNGDYLDCELVIVNMEACDCKGLERQNGSSLVSHFRVSHPDALELVCFDLLYRKGTSCMHVSWRKRRDMLEALVCDLNHEKVHCVLTFEIRGKGAKQKFLETMLGEGAEGIVLKRADSPYAPGSRCLSWIKVKPTDTYDVVLTSIVGSVDRWTVRPGDVLYPEGKESSTFKAGWVRLGYGFYSEDNQLYEVGHCLTGPPEEMEALIGQVAEFKAWGQYSSGALKHPQFVRLRDDKAPEECVFDFGRGGDRVRSQSNIKGQGSRCPVE